MIPRDVSEVSTPRRIHDPSEDTFVRVAAVPGFPLVHAVLWARLRSRRQPPDPLVLHWSPWRTPLAPIRGSSREGDWARRRVVQSP